MNSISEIENFSLVHLKHFYASSNTGGSDGNIFDQHGRDALLWDFYRISTVQQWLLCHAIINPKSVWNPTFVELFTMADCYILYEIIFLFLLFFFLFLVRNCYQMNLDPPLVNCNLFEGLFQMLNKLYRYSSYSVQYWNSQNGFCCAHFICSLNKFHRQEVPLLSRFW